MRPRILSRITPLSPAPAERPVQEGPRTRLVAAWAVLFVAATFVEAIYRLGPRALAVVRGELGAAERVALAATVIALGYFEGYRALWRRFAPAVAGRAWAAARAARGVSDVLVAPLVALQLVAAPRRELVRAWLGVTLIVLAVLVVRKLPSPWRGIVDAGVVVALSMGLVGLLRELPRGRAREPGA